MPEIAQKFELAEDYAKLIASDTIEDLVLGYFFWSQLVEGMAFMAGFAPLMNFRRQNLMSGSAEQITYINRDEIQHVAFGLQLIRTILQEESVKLSRDDFYAVVKSAVESETLFAQKCIPSVMGYGPDQHIQYCQYLADRRLSNLGLAPLYYVQNPLPWISELMEVRKERNFFETRTQEYKVGVSLWGNESP